ADESRKLDVETLTVNGLFQAGTANCPIGTGDPKNQVLFNFVGARPCNSPSACTGFNKGIDVKSGGKLRLFGIKGVPASEVTTVRTLGTSWAHLALPAGPEDKYGADTGVLVPVDKGGATTITLDKDITKKKPGSWQVDDWIAISTTSFN